MRMQNVPATCTGTIKMQCIRFNVAANIAYNINISSDALAAALVATGRPHWFFVFTALHVMQTRHSDENSVRLSVRPSHAWIVTKRKKDLSRFLYHTKDKR